VHVVEFHLVSIVVQVEDFVSYRSLYSDEVFSLYEYRCSVLSERVLQRHALPLFLFLELTSHHIRLTLFWLFESGSSSGADIMQLLFWSLL